MFKDVYKRANDRIDESGAKSRVIAKLNMPVPVRKSFGGARIAAIAACFVLTIAVAGVYEHTQKSTPNFTEAIVTEAPGKGRIAAPPEEAKTKDAAKNEAVAAVSDSMYGLETNIGLDDTNFAVAAYSEPGENEIEVTVSEYCEYLGKNIPDVAANLGLTDETPQTQVIASDYTDDSFEFLFTDGDMSFKIETTKNTGEIYEKIANPELKKSKIGDNDAVVMIEQGVMKVYFTAGDIGYTVLAFGCGENDVIELITNLTDF